MRASVTAMADARSYPERPYVAVSAAIVRDGRILVVRRGGPAPPRPVTPPRGGVGEGGQARPPARERPVPPAGGRSRDRRDADGGGRARGARGDRPHDRAGRARGL